MACVLIDTNMLDNEALDEFLKASPENTVVISEATMIEIHKSRAAELVPRLLALACNHWDRVLIARPFHELYAFDGRENDPANAIISNDQTRDFPNYCASVVLAPISLATLVHFSQKQTVAAKEHASLASQAPGLMRLYRRVISSNFTDQDRRELRKRQPLSEGLQRKLIGFSFFIRDRMARQRKHEILEIPPLQAINTPLYRYALSLVIYFMHWVKDGEPQREKPKEAVNQIVDLQIAALATFYDDLATRETKLKDHFEELQALVELLGGKVRCARN